MAGVIKPATPITKLSDADWDFTMDINMKGVFTCLRAELNAISPGGSIVSDLCVCSETASGTNDGLMLE
jgi:NAD(P)-dependent dehydrogenase (short-subunit alcohol dehydrogenase family)